MATINKGHTFSGGETVTAGKLNNLVDGATISNIVNAEIDAAAAIALSKLATGALPTGITVASANIVNGTIVNADINSAAAIAGGKLADGAITNAKVASNAITNAKVASNAAIAGTKIAPNFGSQNVVTTGTLAAGATTLSAELTLGNNDIVSGTGAGTKIGTATTQKLGFWNVTPVVQPAAAAQAAAAAQTQDSLTNSTGGTASTTLAAITAPAANATTSLTTDMTAVRNALASLASQLAKIRTDVENIKTLQNATRTALVNTGIMKGAA